MVVADSGASTLQVLELPQIRAAYVQGELAPDLLAALPLDLLQLARGEYLPWCRLNKLLRVLKRTLYQVQRALKGLDVMSTELDGVATSIFNQWIPKVSF